MNWANRGLSHRPVVMGTRGAVASANPLASRAGLMMLERGGHAVDAAVATAAMLSIAEPYMSGPGGCGYMMLYEAESCRQRVLDYVGPAPAAASLDAFSTPSEKDHGPKSALIPAACAGWMTAHREYGRLSRQTVLGPAIDSAELGVPITLNNHRLFSLTFEAGNLTEQTKAVFMPGGAVPEAGAVITQPLLAETYREIANNGHEPFYRGDLAKRIVDSIASQGGLLSESDLSEYFPVWKDPLSIDYRGFQISCPPPPSTGVQFLETLLLLEKYDLGSLGQNSTETLHLLAEAMKLSVADRIAYSAGPERAARALIDPVYIEFRGQAIDPSRAARSEGERFDGRLTGEDIIQPGDPLRVLSESTTHFDVIDAEGNAVSATQSLGDGFGSGVMAGDTGVMLNNFCYWFDLDPESPNVIGPGGDIEMCVAPAVMTRDDTLFGVIGTPGSWGIPETTPQMISNLLDHEFSIQAAIEAPRIRTYENTVLEIETRIPRETRQELAVRGHEIREVGDWSMLLGGGQGIMVDPASGVFMAGADPRRDGYALAW